MDAIERKLQDQFLCWGQLGDGEKRLLIANTRLVQYSAGQNVRGVVSEPGVILVQSGILRAYLLSEDGKTLTVHWPMAGDSCGFSTIQSMDNASFELYIDSYEDSELLVIATDVFMRVAERNVHVAKYMHEMSAQCLTHMVMAMEKILFVSVERRLLDFIVEVATDHGTSEVFFTHEQLAEAIGTAREVVSRTLKRLADSGYVELFRGGVRIVDETLLVKS